MATTPQVAAAAAAGTPSAVSNAGATTGASREATTTAAASPSAGTPAPTAIPHRDKAFFNEMLVEQYIAKDWIQTAALRSVSENMNNILRMEHGAAIEYQKMKQEYRQWFPPSRLYGEGYRGWGNGHTDLNGPSRIIYPENKPRMGKRQSAPFRVNKKDMARQAEEHEDLVPIRLDVDHDKVKLRDTFTWNYHDRIVPVELFAATLVEDMGLKGSLAQPVYDQVQHQIHEQLTEFFPYVYSNEDPLDPHLPYMAYKNDEMRILVKLNITIGQHTLVDQFEWEINNPMNSPEEFAESMSRDLSLSGEFTTAIAHCIREQSQLFTKSLYSIGHPFDGRPITDSDVSSAFLQTPLPSVFRPQQQAKDYAPYLYELSDADLERNEVIFSREQRRQKRSVNRRGGPQLPDLKERQRTIRTLIVSSVLPGSSSDIENSRLYKRPAGTTTTATGRKRGPGARDGDISDSDESDDSAPDSPAMSQLQLQGTARTRNMRGAASAAQQRIIGIGRSETPEAATIHHHETRTSRRFNREARDSTEEPAHLIVTIKVPRERLRKFYRDAKLKQATPSGSLTPSAQHQRAPSASAPGSMGPPPTTPSASTQSLPPPPTSAPPAASPAASAAASASAAAAPPPTTPSTVHLGRVPAPPPPPPGQQAPPPPPPPQWLPECLQKLLKQYPNDAFEGYMRYCAVDTTTDEIVPPPPAGEPIPDNIKFMYIPRIRCIDCPGKLYTPGPEMTVSNFEVHLKNRKHREKVDLRVGKHQAAAAAAAAASAASATAASSSAGTTASTSAAPAPAAAASASATPRSASSSATPQPPAPTSQA